MKKTKVFILYDYFDPAYKAGGPIRSLVNLTQAVQQELELFILTSDADLDGSTLDVQPDTWLSYGRSAMVMYISKQQRSARFLRSLFREQKPDTVYINGLFSWFFVVLALRTSQRSQYIKTILAPRGMLQKRPLSIKPLKKRIYLFFLRFILPKTLIWHVTTEQERAELPKFIKAVNDVVLIGNLPFFSEGLSLKSSKGMKCIFGTVALISPMKNIHLVLEALSDMENAIIYKIYGPIKDQAYWDRCLQIIEMLPSYVEVEYHGPIPPAQVSEVIRSFDFYIQPSQSENFGHSIFEAFNQGVPVITSDNTPWEGLQSKKAGWDLLLSDESQLPQAITEAISMGQRTYHKYQQGARSVATDYMSQNNLKAAYLLLLSP